MRVLVWGTLEAMNYQEKIQMYKVLLLHIEKIKELKINFFNY